MEQENFNKVPEQNYLEMKRPENVTTGRGMVLHSQAREILFRVYCFILAIHHFLPKRGRGRIRDIVELATGISHQSIDEIKNQYSTQGQTAFNTPQKNLSKNINPVEKTNQNYLLDVLRRTIYRFYTDKKKSPSLDEVHKEMLKTDLFSESRSKLYKLITNDLGFKYKTLDNRKYLCERYHIKLLRFKYLKEIFKLRSLNYIFLFIDETWFNINSTVSKGFVDNSDKCFIKKPTGLGERIMIVGCFSSNGELIIKNFRCKNVGSADYHQNMNASNFQKIFEEFLQYFRNIYPESKLCVIMDIAK